MLHVMSNTTDPSKFMTVHHITLNGDRTSDQSRALQKKIYRMQMKNYKKGLALLANISAEEAYANGFTKRTADKHRAGTISFEIRLPVDQRKLGIYEKRTSLRTGNSSTSTGLSIQLPKDSRMEYFHIFLLV